MPGVRARMIACLRSMEAEGTLSVPLDEGARQVLRAWMLAARGRRPAGSAPAAPGAAVGGAPVPGAACTRPPSDQTTLSEQPEQPEQPARSGAVPEAPEEGFLTRALAEVPPPGPGGVSDGDGQEEDIVPFFRPGGATPEEVWSNFARMLPRWEPLRALGTLRETAVPGEGNRAASIMFVGDAPNYYDERSLRPFSGAAGDKLDGMLAAMGLTREAVYITHAVPFRPALPRQTTNNRPPGAEEIRFSRPVLETQANLVQPRVIVALGVIAARCMLGGDELPLDSFRRKDHRFAGIPVVVTHHPSYLLRTSDLAERRLVWEDMLRAMELAGLPVSEKQRRYFLPR